LFTALWLEGQFEGKMGRVVRGLGFEVREKGIEEFEGEGTRGMKMDPPIKSEDDEKMGWSPWASQRMTGFGWW